MRFVMLEDVEERQIWVNMDLILWMQPHHGGTQLYTQPQGKEDKEYVNCAFSVRQGCQEILSLAERGRQGHDAPPD